MKPGLSVNLLPNNYVFTCGEACRSRDRIINVSWRRRCGILICPEILSPTLIIDDKMDIPTIFVISLFAAGLKGDTAHWFKRPDDIKTKVPFWPCQVRAGQAKTELLFRCQREV